MAAAFRAVGVLYGWASSGLKTFQGNGAASLLKRRRRDTEVAA